MAERTEFHTDPNPKILRQFSRKDSCRVDLIQFADGRTCVRRSYDHPVPAYEALLGHEEPSLPQIYTCYTAEGLFFVEEEYVDGLALSQLLEACLPDDAQVCAVTRQVCSALSVLHSHGFIHRDVKPENILLTSEGRVVLLDLDASTREDLNKPQDTRLLGTIGYAAPEQFGFGRSNVRTDVFSVGVLMNVLRTGRHPSQHLTSGPLRRIIRRCIEVNADQRYPSVEQLLHRLPRTAEPIRCPQCGFVSPGGGCIHCGTPGSLRRPRLRLAVILAAAAIFGSLALFLPGMNREAPEAQPASVVMPPAEEPKEASLEEPKEASLEEPTEPMVDEPERPLTDADFSDWCTPQMVDTLAPFELDGETYYLHPGFVGLDFPSSCSGIDSREPTRTVSYRISFWKKISDRPEEYREVTDPEVLQRIQDAFSRLGEGPYGQPVSTLDLTMQAIWTDGMPMPRTYPKLLTDTDHEPWRKALTAELSSAQNGYWLITASGTIDGQTLRATHRLWWRVLDISTITPDPTLETPVIRQINEKLNRLSLDFTEAVEIFLPAGEYEGYLEIPDTLYDIQVFIRGSEEGATMIRGGIHNSNSCCEVFGVHLIGAGKDLEAWPEGSANFGRPNSGFYGGGMGRLNGSVAEGFHCGMVSTEGFKTGDDTLYRDNHVGVRFATDSNNGGNHNMIGNRFENNTVGISFEVLHDEFPLSWFDLSGNEFQNNGTDIQNLLEQELDTTGMIFHTP